MKVSQALKYAKMTSSACKHLQKFLKKKFRNRFVSRKLCVVPAQEIKCRTRKKCKARPANIRPHVLTDNDRTPCNFSQAMMAPAAVAMNAINIFPTLCAKEVASGDGASVLVTV